MDYFNLFEKSPYSMNGLLNMSFSFVLLKSLRVINETPQKNKQCEEVSDDNHQLSIAKCSHLTDLYLIEVHEDYLEQFLLHTRTFFAERCFPFA